MQRGKAHGGSRGNQGRKVGRVEPSDGKGTLEQPPEAPEGPETRGLGSHQRRGPRTNREREETDIEATTATTDREDSTQREDVEDK